MCCHCADKYLDTGVNAHSYQNAEFFYRPRRFLPSLLQLLPIDSNHCFDLSHQKQALSVLELHINEITQYVLLWKAPLAHQFENLSILFMNISIFVLL